MLTAGLTLAALLVSNSAPGPVDPTAYRMEVSLISIADLSAMGGAEMESSLNATLWFRLSMSDTTGARIASMTVDSVQYDVGGQAGAEFPPGLGESIAGATVRGRIVNGRLDGAPQYPAGLEQNPLLQKLVAPAAFSGLFPGVAPEPGRRAWADTTTTDNSADGTTATAEAIANWEVTGQEGDVLLLRGTSTSSITTSNPQMESSGTVDSKIEVETVSGGPARRASITTEQALSMLIPAAPDIIPVNISTVLNISALP